MRGREPPETFFHAVREPYVRATDGARDVSLPRDQKARGAEAAATAAAVCVRLNFAEQKGRRDDRGAGFVTPLSTRVVLFHKFYCEICSRIFCFNEKKVIFAVEKPHNGRYVI